MEDLGYTTPEVLRTLGAGWMSSMEYDDEDNGFGFGMRSSNSRIQRIGVFSGLVLIYGLRLPGVMGPGFSEWAHHSMETNEPIGGRSFLGALNPHMWPPRWAHGDQVVLTASTFDEMTPLTFAVPVGRQLLWAAGQGSCYRSELPIRRDHGAWGDEWEIGTYRFRHDPEMRLAVDSWLPEEAGAVSIGAGNAYSTYCLTQNYTWVEMDSIYEKGEEAS